jgi:hypothetical protein
MIRRSDSRGSFEFNALVDGQFELAAALDQEQSDPELTTVRQSGATPFIRVVLQPSDTLTGWVVGENGEPIPGVAGSAFAEPAQAGQVARLTDFSTDMQGFFRARLDRPIRNAVQIVIAGAGRPVSVFRLKPSNGGVQLRIPMVGGVCRIDFEHAADTANALPSDIMMYALVNDQEGVVSLMALVTMNAAAVVPKAANTTVVIPALAPGRWRLVKFSSLRAGLLASAGIDSPPTGSQFVVSANQTSRVIAK